MHKCTHNENAIRVIAQNFALSSGNSAIIIEVMQTGYQASCKVYTSYVIKIPYLIKENVL